MLVWSAVVAAAVASLAAVVRSESIELKGGGKWLEFYDDLPQGASGACNSKSLRAPSASRTLPSLVLPRLMHGC